MVVGVVMGIDGLPEKGRFSTSWTVNVAHAFSSGIGAGFLLSCFCVVCCDAGAVFAFFSASILFGQWLLVVACSCPQFARLSISCLLSLHWWGVVSSCAISAALDFRLACPGMVVELLAIEALLRPFHTWPHSEAPGPSRKSCGVFLPCQNKLQYVCVICQFCVVPLCHPCGL